jgi:hypothetical protein
MTAADMSINSANLAQLRILQRQYLQLVDPSQLRWPDAQVLKSPAVQSWMFSYMFDESNVKSPPPERYQLRVLKLLISKLERSIVDPEEDVRFPISSRCFFRHVSRPVALYTVFHIVQMKNFTPLANASMLESPSAANHLLSQQAGDFG